tara:strand:- start:715 stop:1020 length:306 start_codon:yes stop_codon:yes gene_type:complete
MHLDKKLKSLKDYLYFFIKIYSNKSYLTSKLLILRTYLLLFTQLYYFDFINLEFFFLMRLEKDFTNAEVLTEKTFWELLTEENIDRDEILYGEGEIRQEDY